MDTFTLLLILVTVLCLIYVYTNINKESFYNERPIFSNIKRFCNAVDEYTESEDETYPFESESSLNTSQHEQIDIPSVSNEIVINDNYIELQTEYEKKKVLSEENQQNYNTEYQSLLDKYNGQTDSNDFKKKLNELDKNYEILKKLPDSFHEQYKSALDKLLSKTSDTTYQPPTTVNTNIIASSPSVTTLSPRENIMRAMTNSVNTQAPPLTTPSMIVNNMVTTRSPATLPPTTLPPTTLPPTTLPPTTLPPTTLPPTTLPPTTLPPTTLPPTTLPPTTLPPTTLPPTTLPPTTTFEKTGPFVNTNYKIYSSNYTNDGNEIINIDADNGIIKTNLDPDTGNYYTGTDDPKTSLDVWITFDNPVNFNINSFKSEDDYDVLFVYNNIPSGDLNALKYIGENPYDSAPNALKIQPFKDKTSPSVVLSGSHDNETLDNVKALYWHSDRSDAESGWELQTN